MEKRKSYYGFLFAAVFLIVAGAAGIVFAAGGSGGGTGGGSGSGSSGTVTNTAMTVSTMAITTSSSGSSATSYLSFVTSGALTTSSAIANTSIDSNITVKFSQNVSDAAISSKVSLNQLTETGEVTGSAIGTNVSYSNKNVVIDPIESLTADTYYKVTVGSGINNIYSVSSDTSYFAIFKTETISPSASSLQAMYLYPANSEKDVPINASLQIGLTGAVDGTNITAGEAVRLYDGTSDSSAAVAAAFSLSSDGTMINIVPNSSLQYGKDYKLAILENKITDTKGNVLTASSITFKTTSFSTVSATAVTSGSGLTITANLTNASSSDQNVKVAYVVRRDKGARLEYGGTVVVKDLSTSASCAAGAVTPITINLSDITQNALVSSLTGTVYVDLYLVNNSGSLLYDPIHICAN